MKTQRYVDRDAELRSLATGKKILHLGCVGTTDGTSEEKIMAAERSLHGQLTRAASECTGVDLDGDAIAQLQTLGIFHNVIKGNVERLGELPLDDAGYDAIIAGDIIEHVSNPGLMLEGIKLRLNKDGLLVVSTPNAFGIAAWLRFLRGRFREGNQHVLCFNAITLRQLLSRHGFDIIESSTCYQARAEASYGSSFKLFRAILRRHPRFGGTLLLLCKRNEQKERP